MKRFFITLISLTLFLVLQANQYNLTSEHLTIKHGLASNTILSMLQDKNGYIWIATDKGVNRFDGHNILTYELPKKGQHSPVTSIEEDTENGILWFFTNDGSTYYINQSSQQIINYDDEKMSPNLYPEHHLGKLYLWRYNKDECQRIRFNNGKFISETFKHRIRKIVSDDAGNNWILTDRGVFLNGFDKALPKSEEILYIQTYRNICLALSHNHLYIYNQSRKIIRISPYPAYFDINTLSDLAVWNENLLIFTQKNTINYQIIDNVYSIPTQWKIENGKTEYKSERSIYISGKQKNLIRLDKNGKATQMQLIPEGPNHNEAALFHITQINSSTEAIAVYGNGVFLHNTIDGKLTHYTKNDDKPIINSNYITHLMSDKSGCLWLSEESLGLNILRFKTKPCQYWLPNANSAIQNTNNITAITPSGNQTLWIGNTLGEVYRCNTNTHQNSLIQQTQEPIQCLYSDSLNHLWIGTKNGLWIGNKLFKIGENDLIASSIFDIETDKQGNVWLATNKGIHKAIRNAQTTYFETINNDLLHIFDIEFDDKGRIWAATDDGIAVYEENNAECSHKLLSGMNINTLKIDKKGIAWAGSSEGGLWKCMIKENNTDCKRILTNKEIYTIAFDHEDNIWITCEEGITRIIQDKMHIQNFRFTENPLSNLYNMRAGCTLNNGILLFGTYEGVAEINVNDVVRKESLSPTTITMFNINGKTQTTQNKALELKHKHNELTIHVSNMQYANLPAVRYQYKLNGKDSAWSTPTATPYVNYHTLPPGKYTFNAKSDNARNQWSEEATYEIIVFPPWWNTWYAHIFYLIILGCFGFYIRYVLKLRKKTPSTPVLFASEEKDFPKENIKDTTENTPVDTNGEMAYMKIASQENDISENKEEKKQLSHKEELFIDRLKKILAENASNSNFSVDELAAQLNIKRSQLYVKCKNLMDTSPAALLKEARIEHAAYLLLQTELSIEEIRLQCGFANSTNFFNQFRKHFGKSPLQYRKTTK